MRTRRRSYTAATPEALLREAVTEIPEGQSLPVSGTRRRNLQPVKTKESRGSKKKKCIRLWDLSIPLELLEEILSRLGLKANIRASAVCKTWFDSAVSVRKSKPRPWLFYRHSGSHYILDDPLGSQTHELNFPSLKDHKFCYSRDGSLLVTTHSSVFLLNPFTREQIYLPEMPTYSSRYCLAFSAAPTSSSCVVISYVGPGICTFVVVNTWRPSETVWTTHRFENQLHDRTWARCVFSSGMFYCLSTCGYLGVFDPSRETWSVLQVKPCSAFSLSNFSILVLMMEHEGDVFVMYSSDDNKNNPSVFKLNLKFKVWEKKRELGGLTVFTSYAGSFARAGLSAEHRNRIYPLKVNDEVKRHGMYYYSLGDEKSSYPPPRIVFSPLVAWVDPPLHNNLNS